MRRAVGFTGTQRGMTDAQQSQIRSWLEGLDVTELHHGDCVGADAQADAIARELGMNIVIHPPVSEKKRAFCWQEGDIYLPSLPYLERNHDIVDSCPILLAAPLGDEQVRSGTWATIRYAKKRGKHIYITRRDHA